MSDKKDRRHWLLQNSGLPNWIMVLGFVNAALVLLHAFGLTP